MSEQENDAFIHEVFKSGAFLVVKRPLTMDAVRHMRQDVIRKRMHTHEKYENKDVIIKTERQDMDIQETRSSGSGKNGRCEPKKRVHQSSDDDNDDYNDEISMKKKICVEWTEELHEKFVNAVRQLGEGRCFPKKILDLMAVPGLTRMQVASHLQKCRKEKMNFNYDKKTTQNNVLSSNLFPQGLNERRFGCMPSLQTNANNHEESNTLIGINLSINGWQAEVNHMKNQTYRGSSSMLNISNQKNIAQRIEYTQIPFGSDLALNQDDGFGSRIIKATNNYFQQTISGLRDPGQGSNDQNLPLIKQQVSEEFPDFLKDLDGNGPNDI
ncbi:hypothetical protein SSX86_019951 [Deinandra increscens subsp. villosa]|uniref:HTH myb-type domain-containing protein n=1 Tax=Deinandra increscens subsp. villosa TaxID=3103831 RepID=A0AAP0GV03_9ASTR